MPLRFTIRDVLFWTAVIAALVTGSVSCPALAAVVKSACVRRWICRRWSVAWMPQLPTVGQIMDENKITAAVLACITDALKSDKPFRSINESLAMLKRHGWTEADRLEVQTQVLQELKRRRSTK